MYYVYLLADVDKRFYIGYSHDLRKRLKYHESGDVTTTKKYHQPKLVWYCAFTNKKKALDFEKYLKVGSGHAFAHKHLA